MRRSILILFAVCLLPSSGGAQSVSGLRTGDHVRIRAVEASGRFTVLETRADSLILRRVGQDGEVRIPIASIRRIDLSHGPRRRLDGAVRRGGMGMLVAGAGGVVLGLAEGDDTHGGWFEFTAGEKAVMYGTALGVIGGVSGAIGGLIWPGERLERLSIVRGAEVGLDPRGGLRLGVTFVR